MALTCRWRRRPQHQKQTSTVATATSVRWHRAAGAPGLISRTLAEMLLRRKSGDGLAMSVAEYASYDAVGLAELVRKREVSPTELVEAAIERIEKHRMRQPFPKLRLCPILKASCSSLRPARARPAVRRRPRPLRLHQDLGAASCCP